MKTQGNGFLKHLKFSNHDIKKFVLCLKKGVYPYEYMDDRKKFNESLLPENKVFYSHLNIEDTTYADYMHAKRVRKDFKITKLGEYHDLYVQSNTL